MARQRMIRPEIWASEQVAALTDWEFRVYVGLISMADDEGRLRANPVLLSAQLFPTTANEQTPGRIRQAVLHMEARRDRRDGSPLICLYQVGDEVYIYHPNWKSHQVINRPSPSKLPEPPETPEIYFENRSVINAFGYGLINESVRE